MTRLNDTKALAERDCNLEHKLELKGEGEALRVVSRPSASPDAGRAKCYVKPPREADCGIEHLRSTTMVLGNRIGDKR